MKLKLYMLMMTLFAFSAVSCSDDDEPVIKPAEQVATTYDGYTVANCKYFTDMATDNQSVTITATGDATVNVSYTSDSWGTFTITGATVSESGNQYIIKGTGVTVMGMNGNEKEYECTFEGVVQAPHSSAMVPATFKFSIAAVMGGMTIEFTEGEMPVKLIVAGTYSGYVKASAAYFPDGMYADNQTLTVSANSDGTYKVTYTSDTWGTFTITGAEVSKDGSNYILTGDGVTLMGMSADSQKEYECTLTATIDADKNNPSFVFKVPSVMGGLTVEFLTGEMPVTE